MFRGAYRSRRCVVPASGFYEWTGKKGDKQPHIFVAADGSPILALAGLRERWRDPHSHEETISAPHRNGAYRMDAALSRQNAGAVTARSNRRLALRRDV